jgi:hypothetical protein
MIADQQLVCLKPPRPHIRQSELVTHEVSRDSTRKFQPRVRSARRSTCPGPAPASTTALWRFRGAGAEPSPQATRPHTRHWHGQPVPPNQTLHGDGSRPVWSARPHLEPVPLPPHGDACGGGAGSPLAVTGREQRPLGHRFAFHTSTNVQRCGVLPRRAHERGAENCAALSRVQSTRAAPRPRPRPLPAL